MEQVIFAENWGMCILSLMAGASLGDDSIKKLMVSKMER